MGSKLSDSQRQAIAAASQTTGSSGEHQRERKVRGAMDYLFDGIRLLFTLAGIAFVAALADGARREYGEYYASVAAFVPPVAARHGETKLTVKPALALENRDVVTTAARGTATLRFPDGSAVFVEPQTRFVVQLLDYNRGAKRDRSFLLRSGAVFVRISKLFGKKGQTLICTPNAVAAARGTGFSVRHDAGSNHTFVEVVDGTVALRTAGGRIEIKPGQTGSATGDGAPVLGTLSNGKALRGRFATLAKLDPPRSPLESFERDALATLDPALRLVALTPRGFNFGDSDLSRRANTRQSLTLLQQALEAVSGDVPGTLNPVTMRELGLSETEREKILGAFAGFSVDRYEKRGQNAYRIVVRSRDAAGTVFELTETGVREQTR